MKVKTLALLSFVILTSFSKKSEYLDPTGTYHYEKTKTKDGEVYGYIGAIKIKKYSENQVVMSFVYSKGAPSYNLGSFIDTLIYKANKVIYQPRKSCQIEFSFFKNGVNVIIDEKKSDCDFGMGIVAKGFFKKKSSEEPEIIDFINQ